MIVNLNLTRVKTPSYLVKHYSGCVYWGCFKRLAFELLNWERRSFSPLQVGIIQSTEGLKRTKGKADMLLRLSWDIPLHLDIDVDWDLHHRSLKIRPLNLDWFTALALLGQENWGLGNSLNFSTTQWLQPHLLQWGGHPSLGEGTPFQVCPTLGTLPQP